MNMNTIKMLCVSAALSLAPLTASAVTFDADNTIAPGDTGIDILSGPYFFDATFRNDDAAGSFSFGFTNTSASDVTVGTVIGTVLQSTGRFLGGLTVSWANGTSATFSEGATGFFRIISVLAAGSSDTLTLNYGDPVGGPRDRANVDFTVAAVPLPAGGLLLLTALGGAAALRRRKKATA